VRRRTVPLDESAVSASAKRNFSIRRCLDRLLLPKLLEGLGISEFTVASPIDLEMSPKALLLPELRFASIVSCW